jgi:geranylgeranyl pyrophosphate synthase
MPRANLKKEILNQVIECAWMNMTTEPEMMEKVKGIVERRGKAAIEKAAREILSLPYMGGKVSSALKYFAEVTLQGALPVFPTLISLSFDAAGGTKAEKTTNVGAALTLAAAAADIHDDIIDQSRVKYSRKTVFGKFGGDIALLAGDALLVQGMMLLHEECNSLPDGQRKAILSLVSDAIFGISNAEAKETGLRRKLETTAKEYSDVIKLKSVVPEVHCKIGAILGNANEATVKSLGDYGRTFGTVASIKEEFIDLMDCSALQNRIQNEVPPLPLLYALQNSRIMSELTPLLKNSILTRKSASRIVRVVLGSEEAQRLKKDADSTIEKQISVLCFIRDDGLRDEVALLLKAMAVEL